MKTHRRAGMNRDVQVIRPGKIWAITHFSCLFEEGLLLWIKSSLMIFCLKVFLALNKIL